MINVPLAQSIRFRPVNTDLPNFDNTFNCERTDMVISPYIQYLPEQEIQIQVVTPDDNETQSYLYLIHNGTRVLITDSSTSYISELKYDTYTVDLSLYVGETCYFEAFSEVLDEGQILGYSSESFTVATDPKYLLFEWSNNENAFSMDYSVGLTHVLQLQAKIRKLSAGGESSVYMNQGEEVKLKGIYARIFQVEIALPDYIAEQLTLAMEHDCFYINEVEFVVSKKPTLTQMGDSNMYIFVAEVRQKTIVGLNTHDVGYVA